MKRVFIVGGHLTPAFATAQELASRGWKIFYIGRKHALEGDRAPSQEWRVITAAGYDFLPITAGRVQRNFTIHTIPSLFKIPVGFFQAVMYLFHFRPDVVVAFGGYVSAPVLVACALFHIPVVLHEQTLLPGLTSKYLSFFARIVCVSWPESASFFPFKQVVVTGNPLRMGLTPAKDLQFQVDKPLIYITGGNLGSHAINEVVGQCVDELTKEYVLIHQTGNSQEYQDFQKMNALRERLPTAQKNRYHVFEYVDVEVLSSLIPKIVCMISRAGANTVSEIITFAIPSILIPLPHSGNGEQAAQANYLKDAGAALTISQSDISARLLLNTIKKLRSERKNIVLSLKQLQKKSIPQPSARLADVIESVAK